MPLSADHPALLRLLHSGARPSAVRTLLDRHGSAAAAASAGPEAWRAAGLDADACSRLTRRDGADMTASLAWLDHPRHHLVGWHDSAYPPLLREASAPPAMLFVAGDPLLAWRPAVAVVGSRSATAGGRANAAAFATAFAGAGLCVASGMAAGVDTAAHQAALGAGGATLAVLGTGPDVAYPRHNRALLARLEDEGAVLSEHPPGTGPLRSHFPSRNRIIAGLSLATVVVEAAERSGALITARLAADAGREVFALPGSIHNPLARGCHRLIRDGVALAEGPAEILAAIADRVRDLARELQLELRLETQLGNTAAAANAAFAPARRPARTAASSASVAKGSRHAPAPDPVERLAARAGGSVPAGARGPGDHVGKAPVRDGDPVAPAADPPDVRRLLEALGHDPACMDELILRSGLPAAATAASMLALELDGRVACTHGRYTRLR